MEKLHAAMHRMHNPDLGIFLMRLALGIAFIYHGWMKMQSMEMTIGFFGTLGMGAFWAYVATYTELIGGIALILGIFVRYAGLLLAVTMAVAIMTVHWEKGFSLMQGGYEYAFVLMIGSLALVTTGAGMYSLARRMKNACGCCDDNCCEGGMCNHEKM